MSLHDFESAVIEFLRKFANFVLAHPANIVTLGVLLLAIVHAIDQLYGAYLRVRRHSRGLLLLIDKYVESAVFLHTQHLKNTS
ncbi:hypothetical protein VTL71DRAFT_4530 [Oculimacula yallundae]|uniref:Uncharacterized protein n=1 Tax=Oculimacula yallundae TaxID=86028 RepID=A0ABR4C3U1_9HELO